MKRSEEGSEAVFERFRKKKILTLEEIQEAVPWSSMTLWRQLKPIGYYTSFNFNARYYTLAETPRFDENGLWFYRTVGFSTCGTLNQTLVSLVYKSKMGMTPNELSEILTVRVQNQLNYLFKRKQVERVNLGRAHLYLSLDEEAQAEQLHHREAHRERDLGRGQVMPTENEVIEILAELIRSPRSSPRRIAVVLSTRGLDITPEKVQSVIEKYELQKKGLLRRSRR
jgi:hypothetical protein